MVIVGYLKEQKGQQMSLNSIEGKKKKKAIEPFLQECKPLVLSKTFSESMKSPNFCKNAGTIFPFRSSFSHEYTVGFSTVHLEDLHKRINQYIPSNKL